MSSERGFTLIELISCIVIGGILAAIAGQSFIGNQTFSERGYIDEIASALRQAQKVAVASGCDVSVTINAAGYSAFQRGASAGTCAGAGAFTTAVRRNDGTAVSAAPPTGVASAPAIQLTFDKTGRLTAAAPAPLQVGAFTLTVDSGSGLVQVQ
jgi:MSHA pilin protein MshC